MSKLNVDFETEYIICSAIWYKEIPLKKPEILEVRGSRPYNIKSGVVVCGWRHSNCIHQIVSITGLRSVYSEIGEYIQGFLTNKNRFVDRKEGWMIAEKSNQIINKESGTEGFLYSEDLY